MTWNVYWVLQGGPELGRQIEFLSHARHISGDFRIRMVFLRPIDPDDPVVQEFERFGVEVSSLNARAAISPGAMLRLSRWIFRDRPIVAHSHHPPANVTVKVAGLLNRLLGRRIRIINGYRNAPRGIRWRGRILERITQPLADLILCSSAGVETAFFGSARVLGNAGQWDGTRRHWTLPNTIDIASLQARLTPSASARSRLGLEADARYVICVAAFKAQKGHRVLLEAFRNLASDDARLRLILLGSGPLYDDIARRAEELGIADRILMPGFRDNTEEWLCAADLFVLPSYWEGLCKALLEAMAAGVPVVATDVEGSLEALGEGSAGLVPAGDAAALESRMRALLDDDAMRAELVSEQQERVAVFDSGRGIALVEALYRTCAP